MKTLLRAGTRLQVLLPLVMTAVQLGLLAASLIVHREPWVLSDPPEPHALSQSDCSGCVQFSPMPPEPRAGRILKAAMLLNFPAIFLGVVLHLLLVLIHLPHPSGEPAQICFSVVFVPLVWYRVGRWFDIQSIDRNAGRSPHRVTSAWTLLARAVMWLLFLLMLWAFFFERHRHGDATSFMIAIWVLWTGSYLAVGLWGDWRRSARRYIAGE